MLWMFSNLRFIWAIDSALSKGDDTECCPFAPKVWEDLRRKRFWGIGVISIRSIMYNTLFLWYFHVYSTAVSKVLLLCFWATHSPYCITRGDTQLTQANCIPKPRLQHHFEQISNFCSDVGIWCTISLGPTVFTADVRWRGRKGYRSSIPHGLDAAGVVLASRYCLVWALMSCVAKETERNPWRFLEVFL